MKPAVDQAERLRLIAGARSRLKDGVPAGRRPERIIAIGSGKGGVGKSNIALNLAIELGSRGRPTCLFDADLGMANAHILAGLIPRFTLGHVIKGTHTLSDIIAKGPYGIGIISGSSGLYEIANLPADQRERLNRAISALRYDFDFMIIDAGAGISANVLTFMESADQAIIVTTPEPTAMADAYGMIKALCRREFGGRISVVVNRAGSVREARSISEKMVSLSMQFLDQTVDSVGFFLEDAAVGRAVRKRSPFSQSDRSCSAARSMIRMVEMLEKEDNEENFQAAGPATPMADLAPRGRIRGWIERILK